MWENLPRLTGWKHSDRRIHFSFPLFKEGGPRSGGRFFILPNKNPQSFRDSPFTKEQRTYIFSFPLFKEGGPRSGGRFFIPQANIQNDRNTTGTTPGSTKMTVYNWNKGLSQKWNRTRVEWMQKIIKFPCNI